jgi:CheY-like chemotaxis protein
MSQILTILIVDDDQDLRYFLGQILIHYGFAVLEAEHGQHALDLLQTSKPSLLLIDLDMPVMNGKDLILHLVHHPDSATKWGEIPRVVYSARLDLYPEVTPFVEAKFSKPVRHEEIIQTITAILNNR